MKVAVPHSLLKPRWTRRFAILLARAPHSPRQAGTVIEAAVSGADA
ncbi:hypothetical protein [Bradyrhizobium sp. sBnM-33]|nr:hypothetical protein [Bradyrhizobium sp. sBnM-33]WOH51666.1 hypothetical protein RX328_05125 [Bradyrhizobium sp. sBnM-33]